MRCSSVSRETLEELSRKLFLPILNVKSPTSPQPTAWFGWKLDTIELSLVFMWHICEWGWWGQGAGNTGIIQSSCSEAATTGPDRSQTPQRPPELNMNEWVFTPLLLWKQPQKVSKVKLLLYLYCSMIFSQNISYDLYFWLTVTIKFNRLFYFCSIVNKT